MYGKMLAYFMLLCVLAAATAQVTAGPLSVGTGFRLQ